MVMVIFMVMLVIITTIGIVLITFLDLCPGFPLPRMLSLGGGRRSSVLVQHVDGNDNATMVAKYRSTSPYLISCLRSWGGMWGVHNIKNWCAQNTPEKTFNFCSAEMWVFWKIEREVWCLEGSGWEFFRIVFWTKSGRDQVAPTIIRHHLLFI